MSDDKIRGLKYYITHPVMAVTSFVGLLFSLTHWSTIEALGVATWHTIGQVFPLVSIGAFTLAPRIPPTSAIDWTIIVLGGLLAAKTLDTVLKAYDRYI